MHSNRSNAVVLAPCKKCGKEYDERGIKAAFGYCLVCHEKESLEAPYFKVTCKATWLTHDSKKIFFFRIDKKTKQEIIYTKADFPEAVIHVLIAGFYGRHQNGKQILSKYYYPLREVSDDGNRRNLRGSTQ